MTSGGMAHQNYTLAISTKARRRDPEDGRWGTQADFVLYYGGTEEWDEALVESYGAAAEEALA